MMWIDSARRFGIGALTLAVAALSAPTGLAAQDADEECRCVDASGEEIENCSCLRTWDFEDAFSPQRRARIGVLVMADQQEGAERGVRIQQVTEDGPADEAGLRSGDIVLAVAGRRVTDPLEEDDPADDLSGADLRMERFTRLVRELEPGEPADFRIRRDGSERTIEITPEETSVWDVRGTGARWMPGGGVFEFRSSEWERDQLDRELAIVEELAERERLMADEMRTRAEVLSDQRRRMSDQARAQAQELAARERELSLRNRDREAVTIELQRRGDRARALGLELETLGERLGDGRARAFQLYGGQGSGVRVFGDGAVAFHGDPCSMIETEGDEGRVATLRIFGAGGSCLDGVEMLDLNEGLGSYFGTTEGVLIVDVREGSTLGLQAGDVLLEIDGRAIESRDEASRVLRSYGLDEELRLRVRRDGREVEVLGQRREAR